MNDEITIMGKKININKLSDDQVIKLFTELQERELKLDEKIFTIQSKIDALKNK